MQLLLLYHKFAAQQSIKMLKGAICPKAGVPGLAQTIDGNIQQGRQLSALLISLPLTSTRPELALSSTPSVRRKRYCFPTTPFRTMSPSPNDGSRSHAAHDEFRQKTVVLCADKCLPAAHQPMPGGNGLVSLAPSPLAVTCRRPDGSRSPRAHGRPTPGSKTTTIHPGSGSSASTPPEGRRRAEEAHSPGTTPACSLRDKKPGCQPVRHSKQNALREVSP
jgi:hypothetical protein